MARLFGSKQHFVLHSFDKLLILCVLYVHVQVGAKNGLNAV